MTRLPILQLAALNIVLHPHDDTTYVQRFLTAHKRYPGPFKMRGDIFGMVLTALPITPGKAEEGIEGEFVRFMDLSKDEPWFSLVSAEKATASELKDVQIP